MAQRREKKAPPGKERRPIKKKTSILITESIDYIDYKDVKLLQQFIPERSKILPRRISGTCATHQRPLQQAIKRARHLALIPFTTD